MQGWLLQAGGLAVLLGTGWPGLPPYTGRSSTSNGRPRPCSKYLLPGCGADVQRGSRNLLWATSTDTGCSGSIRSDSGRGCSASCDICTKRGHCVDDAESARCVPRISRSNSIRSDSIRSSWVGIFAPSSNFDPIKLQRFSVSLCCLRKRCPKTDYRSDSGFAVPGKARGRLVCVLHVRLLALWGGRPSRNTMEFSHNHHRKGRP